MSNAAHFPLPITIDEITSDWLTAALRVKAPGVTVRNFEIADMNRGTCTKIRLKLDMDEAGRKAGIPDTVMLKGGFEPHSRDYWNMHENEVRGYRDVFPILSLPTPKSFFADYDAERRQGIIIMEDLVRRGVTFCSGLSPQTHDQVARRLRLLAQYHAQTWDSPEFRSGGMWDWVEQVVPKARIQLDTHFPPDVWQRYVESPRGAAVSVRFHDRNWMAASLDRLATYSKSLPHALLHCDTHLGNLFIDVDGSPGFYDSLPHRAPPMKEVTYHMVCALDSADRARCEGALVQHYLDELRRCGVDAPGFDDAMRQFAIFLTYAYYVFIINDSYFQTESVNTAYTARISAAMLDHNTMRLLEELPRK